MATINVNFDAVNGPEQSFNVYELDWAGLTALATYSVSREATIDMQDIDDQVHYITFDSNGTNLSSLISQVPISEPGDPNDLCNFDPTHTYADGDYRLDYIYQDDHITLNTDIVETMQVGVKPDDWGSNPHYFTMEDIYSSVDDTRVMAVVPQSLEFEWDPLTQYYRDKSEKMVRILYLKNGYSFSCSKGVLEYYQDYRTYYGSASVGCTRFSNPFLALSPYDHYLNHYVLTYGRDMTSYAAPTTGSFPYFASIHISPANGGDYAPYQFFFHTVIDGKDHYGVLLVIVTRATGNIASIRGTMISDNFWAANVNPQNQSWWGNDGPSSIHQGGQGSFDAPSDNHGDRNGDDVEALVRSFNSDFSAAYGGFHMYAMDPANADPLREFESNLWDPNVWESFVNLAESPLSAIICCHAVPESLAPVAQGAPAKIEAAGATLSSTKAPTFDEPMIWKHIGDIDVSSYTDSFADYTATNVFIHLPYVGVYKLDTEALMEGSIAVDYIIDMFTADITARVWTSDRFGNHNYRYEYKGNCGKPIPLSQVIGAGAQRFGSIGSTIIRAIGSGLGAHFGSTSAGNGWITGIDEEGHERYFDLQRIKVSNDALTVQNFTNTITNGLLSAASAGASITQSNASGGAITSLTNDQCFLIITRPQWSAPANYRKLFGYPSDCGGTIDEKVHGFLSVRSIRLESVPATPEEKSEIEQLMVAGVYVDNIFEPEE